VRYRPRLQHDVVLIGLIIPTENLPDVRWNRPLLEADFCEVVEVHGLDTVDVKPLILLLVPHGLQRRLLLKTCAFSQMSDTWRTSMAKMRGWGKMRRCG
jgi:hypothetical protein